MGSLNLFEIITIRFESRDWLGRIMIGSRTGLGRIRTEPRDGLKRIKLGSRER